MDKYNIVRLANFLIVGPLIALHAYFVLNNTTAPMLTYLVLFLGIYIILNNLFFFIKNYYIIYDERCVNTIVS